MKKPLGKEINELARDVKKFLHYHLDGYSLGDGQFGILYEVFHSPGISQEKLSKKRNVDKTTTAKAVKKLINNGYIQREKDKADKRVYCLLCTEKAIELMPEIERVIKLENEVLTQDLSEDEVKIFRKMMGKMTNSIDKHLKRMEE
jgi:DNA-binding MarR family transcriptional regulator